MQRDDVEMLTVIVVFSAWLSAILASAVMQRRYLSKGEGFLISTAKSGLLGAVCAISIIAAYFVIASLIWRFVS